MKKYILKRILLAVVTIFLITTLTFFLMYALPGAPFLGDRPLPDNVVEQLNRQYGLDKPIWQRYLLYLNNVLHGNFGVSTVYINRSVTSIIMEAFPVSADLGIRALLFAIAGGTIFGIISALQRNKLADRIIIVMVVIGVSVPSFIMGTFLQYLLGMKFSPWFMQTFHTDYRIFPIARWESFRYTIIPTLVLGLRSMTSITRMLRTSLLDVIGQDYIKTAKAKGLPGRIIVVKHMLKNAIVPVYTMVGRMVGSILTGSFIIENIFSIPGIGKYFINSITAQDYQMTMGLTLFYAIFVVLINLLVDLGYSLIDPRISVAKEI